ncbi:hypothetical protein [Nostoc sp. TCL26-01]|uniref:hypothetical protein n=1 Tax=Nostoc sp. TCL26-01 TaxID=2576904 RepID=UPI0015B9017C|nr:hypothetical protein [Nostoc sp. TCL26-01]QLE55951.1 hypothetical protein FD725_10690 [Nostoc sp. TCL26-01]
MSSIAKVMVDLLAAIAIYQKHLEGVRKVSVGIKMSFFLTLRVRKNLGFVAHTEMFHSATLHST